MDNGCHPKNEHETSGVGDRALLNIKNLRECREIKKTWMLNNELHVR